MRLWVSDTQFLGLRENCCHRELNFSSSVKGHLCSLCIIHTDQETYDFLFLACILSVYRPTRAFYLCASQGSPSGVMKDRSSPRALALLCATQRSLSMYPRRKQPSEGHSRDLVSKWPHLVGGAFRIHHWQCTSMVGGRCVAGIARFWLHQNRESTHQSKLSMTTE